MTASEQIYQLDKAIRYVALCRGGALSLSQPDALENASQSKSDKYEELIVNPALLTLAKQRGAIDCGGAGFVIVGYGNFLQLVFDHADGHASICFENGSNPIAFVEPIRNILNA